MKKICVLWILLVGTYAHGQKAKKIAAPEPDRSCENLLVSAKKSLEKNELTQARDYCEAGLLVCDDLSGSFQSVLRNVNSKIDSQKVEIVKAYESARVLAEKNQNLIKAFYFYNGRFALAFNSGRYGFVNNDGQVLIDYKYSSAIPFGQKYGYAIVKKQDNGPEFLLDTTRAEFKLTRNVNFLTDTSITACITSIRTRKERFAIFDAKQLKILFVEDSRGVNQTLLRRLVAGLKDLPELTTLGLANTGITTIPRGIFLVPHLLTLDLSNNKLGLSEEVFPNDSLEKSNIIKLDLSNNQLDSIPSRIAKLKNLQYLNLLGNKISRAHLEEIKTWLPNRTILYKDYYEEPQKILAEIKIGSNLPIDDKIKLYQNLTSLLEGYHREVPFENGIKTMLYESKADLAWNRSFKLTRIQAGNAKPSYDSLARYQIGLRDSLLVFNDSLPNDPIIRFRLAQCYGNLGFYKLFLAQYEEAERICRLGLETSPSQTFIKLNLAHALLWQNEYDEAVMTYREFLVSEAACKSALQDFEDFRKAGVPVHPDVAKIKAMIGRLNFFSKGK
ncbi:WG containing repeat-containing protein [Dyadobacter sp. SG02]|uniref:leucine-rich repeat domain-containing protein n=1 Tax=Dyadobacter sp. SG02 TaxID=1855291 RepID=UPI0008B11C8C|nr:leucine-rich repeat domain-containing protein [Dyadobacter sp. SG02]SEJ59775.1 WG containing repeat-containing protein [Dyadobacter sp. SG02]